MISDSNFLQQDKTIEWIIFSKTFGKETYTDFTPFLVEFKMMCLCATLVLESSVKVWMCFVLLQTRSTLPGRIFVKKCGSGLYCYKADPNFWAIFGKKKCGCGL